MAISFKKEVILEAIQAVLAESKAFQITSQDGTKTTQSFANDDEARKFKQSNTNIKDVEALEEDSVEEDHHEDPNDESDMAKIQLHNTAKYCIELLQMIKDGQQLDAWVQDKLSVAFEYIDTVKHYLEGEEYLASTEAPSEEEPLMEEDFDDVEAPADGFEDDAAKAPKGDKKLNKAASKDDKIISKYKEIQPLFKKAAAGDKEALAIVIANQDVVKAYKKMKQI